MVYQTSKGGRGGWHVAVNNSGAKLSFQSWNYKHKVPKNAYKNKSDDFQDIGYKSIYYQCEYNTDMALQLYNLMLATEPTMSSLTKHFDLVSKGWQHRETLSQPSSSSNSN